MQGAGLSVSQIRGKRCCWAALLPNPLTGKRRWVTAECRSLGCAPSTCPLAGSVVIGIFKSPTRDKRSGHWEGPIYPGRHRMVVKQERPPCSPGAWGPHCSASTPGSGEGLSAWPSCCYRPWRKARRSPWSLYYKNTNPIHEGSILII